MTTAQPKVNFSSFLISLLIAISSPPWNESQNTAVAWMNMNYNVSHRKSGKMLEKYIPTPYRGIVEQVFRLMCVHFYRFRAKNFYIVTVACRFVNESSLGR